MFRLFRKFRSSKVRSLMSRKLPLRFALLETRDVPSGSTLWDFTKGPARFDFGTPTSPVASGYTRASELTVYDPAATGYGWLPGAAISSIDRGTGSDINRDFVQGKDRTFAVDLANGTYSVAVVLGDTSTRVAHDQIGVYLEGSLVTTASPMPGNVFNLSTRVTVQDNQLNLGLRDLGGNDPNFVVNSLVITPTTVVSPPVQTTFAASGAVNEGSSGSVAFANPPSNAVAYNYDFNSDGTFEVTNSTSPTATVPASFLSDGPKSVTVTATIRNSLGAVTTYTAPIAVNNVNPTASPSGPTSGSTGAALQFRANASDPSPVDAASLSYLWNFGDGTSASTSDPTHVFANAGTYAVTLKVMDKDGGSYTSNLSTVVSAPAPAPAPTPGSTITASFGTIPNFAANPTIVAARSGNWSDASTWSQGRVPVAGDIVAIGNGMTVTYDVLSNTPIETVGIQPGGRLVFRTDMSTKLLVTNLLVMEGGELQVGTEANPVAANCKAQISFTDLAIDTAQDPMQYGNGLIGLGKITMHGAIKSDTSVRLATEPRQGDTTLRLAAPVTGWNVGERLVLGDTRQFREDALRYEVVVVSAISADRTTLTLNAPLAYDHLGGRDTNGNLDFLPVVGTISRNVVVNSQNMYGVRGHALFADRAIVDIRYSIFGGLGRTTNAAPDNTTVDGNGNITHLGTNQDGRYPVQFRHLIGPTSAPANGYQYTFQGNAVFCPVDPMPFKWGITIDDSHYGLIKDNVVYNWAGAGIVTVRGNESRNVIDHNYVVRVNGTGTRGDDHLQDSSTAVLRAREGANFWLGGTNNYVRNNIAANAQQYGFMLYGSGADPLNIPVPAYQGADPRVSGQGINGTRLPILEFSGNEVYGNNSASTIWFIGANYVYTSNIGESVIRDFKVWNTRIGLFAYPMANVTFDRFVMRGDTSLLAYSMVSSNGLLVSDYLQSNFVVKNSDIQGLQAGIVVPSKTGDVRDTGTAPRPFIVENTYLKNFTNVYTETMNAVTGGGVNLAPRVVTFRNDRFDLVTRPANRDDSLMPRNFFFNYLTSPDIRPGYNWVQPDQYYIENYNNVAGANYQLFWAQQDANFIVPASSSAGVGAPVAGLTNQQAWSQYRIAVAGSIAPSTASTRADIVGGLIQPL